MSDKEILKTATDLAEKEIQEKEIERVKEIVKDYLKEIKLKEGQHKQLAKEISLLKKDLDDFKAGRLDKIVERQKIEPLAPKIVIITRVEKEYLPYTPWYSPFIVQYPAVQPLHIGNSPIICGGNTLTTLCASAINTNITGGSAGVNGNLNTSMGMQCSNATPIIANVFKNFAGGSYKVDGEVINL